MILIIFLLTNTVLKTTAQPDLAVYTDILKNTYSDGLFMRSAFLGNYKFESYNLKAGLQTSLINGNENAISGCRIDGSKDFIFKKVLLELGGFGLWNIHSDILKEANFGCLISTKTRHFDFQIGTNFRTYIFRNETIKKHKIENAGTKIHENFNLIYSFGYNLKPANNKWNAGLNITNIDYFMINQETNPYINLKGSYKVNRQLRLFGGFWYKTAGVLNLSSNYFGFLMRGGITWNFN